MSINFLAGQASLWVQPDGPNTEPKYLGCHSVGDIPEPKGDTTLLWCPDPAQTGKFVVKNSFQGEPGTITTSIETDLRSIADYLEDLAEYGCPFPLFVHKVASGRRDVFSNFDRSFVLMDAKITNATLAKLASRNSADEGESTQSFDLSVDQLLRVFNMELTRVTVSETETLTAIAVAGELICASESDVPQKPQDDLWVSSTALAGSAANTADVLRSQKGAAFAPTAADPFIAAMDAQGIVAFKVSRTVTRILTAIGTTQAGAPCHISYSDNNGVTWTEVHVGSTNGEFVNNGRCLVALDLYHIWLVTNLGVIYFSGDGGITWAAQGTAPSATVGMGISMYDGENGAVIYAGGPVATTVDGLTWSLKTTSGLTNGKDVHMISPNVIWAVGTQGMRYSNNGGTTWNTRTTAINIAAIDFLNEMFGVAVGGSGTNDLVYTTIDGGYDWLVSPVVANSGFNFVEVVSTKLAYVTGLINTATGFLGKLQPAS